MRALPVLPVRRALRALHDAGEAMAAEAERATREGLATSLAEGARRAAAVMDAAVERGLARGGPVACAAGCASCCHVHVEVTRAEVVAIAIHLRSSRTEEERARFTKTLAEHVARTGDLDAAARWGMRVPCALLGSDGRCTIYEVRPLRCRAFHSTSAEACRRADEEPPLVRAIERATDAVDRGFDRALEAASESAAPLVLEAALRDELDRLERLSDG